MQPNQPTVSEEEKKLTEQMEKDYKNISNELDTRIEPISFSYDVSYVGGKNNQFLLPSEKISEN